MTRPAAEALPTSAAPMWWDGGDRAITAREKATIEEHGPSCYTVPLVPAQAVDPTDPWRGLYLPARMPAPSEYGDLTHPDIPLWPDDREDALDKLVHAQGFDFHIVAGDFTEEAMEDGDELYWQELRAWNPEAPEGEWRLAWKGDTEDGPYAWFVRPMALRPEPVALAAIGKQQASFPWENLPAYLIDKCEGDTISEEGIQRAVADMARDARYCQQQVGEVQGDARSKFEAWARGECLSLHRYDSGPYSHDRTFSAWLAWQAALAARQPGAPRAWLIHWSQIPLEAPEVTTSASRIDAVSALTDPPHIEPLYAAPPAQGVDLGPVAALVWQARVYLQGGLNSQCMNKLDDLQTLIGQRDAAPGASHG